MTIKELINRAYMQVGDTSHTNYTPYEFLEYYNEGNQILCHLIRKYFEDSFLDTTYRERDTIDNDSGWESWEEALLVHYMVYKVLKMDISAFLDEMEQAVSEEARMDDSAETCIVAKGYWNYDDKRTDYGN